MFKKVVALTLALVMLIMPMTASAVTWNQIVTGLKAGGGSYTSDDGKTTATQEGDVTTVTGGTIDLEMGVISGAGKYYFVDVQSDRIVATTSSGETILLAIQGDSDVAMLAGIAENSGSSIELLVQAKADSVTAIAENGAAISVKVEDGGAVTNNLMGSAAGSSSSASIEIADGSVNRINGSAQVGGELTLINDTDGTLGMAYVSADGGEASITNNGEVTDYVSGGAVNGGSVSAVNNGEVAESFRGSAKNEGSTVKVENNGSAGSVFVNVGQNAYGELVNSETGVTSSDDFASGAFVSDGGRVNFKNLGALEDVYVTTETGAMVFFDNANGAVDYMVVDAETGTSVGINNNEGSIDKVIVDVTVPCEVIINDNGTVGESTVYLSDGMDCSDEEIKQIVESIGLKETYVLIEDENGEITSVVEILEDGTVNRYEIEEEEEDEPEPQPAPDPIEEQRQAEAIGGVTTSPVWNWQGYLGHSSKPMWIYVNGEKVLMRQRLFWVGDGTKNHTCRINVTEPDPASIELRVGLDMLRTAQRAEISVISILDENGNAIAQFAVNDLLGAFEQYGLVEGELLCVSADADAEVMKVTLDGEYLPLEA